MNVMETLGIPVASIGMTEPPDAEARVLARSRDGIYRKLIISRDRLVGAILVGDVSEAGPITMLIRRGVPLSTLKRFDPSRFIRYAELAVHR
jgi:NAD(P)H-nitrite reductase large subunit